MIKIKVSIMTNTTYPSFKVVNEIISINETEKSYYWEYKEIEKRYKTNEGEYPVELIIEEAK